MYLQGGPIRRGERVYTYRPDQSDEGRGYMPHLRVPSRERAQPPVVRVRVIHLAAVLRVDLQHVEALSGAVQKVQLRKTKRHGPIV
eukprot:8826792-Pyramimonas_sp.AAC.1